MKVIHKIVPLLIFSIGSHLIHAQGCSDAGVCTVSSFTPNSNDSINNQLKIGAFYGSADHNINVSGVYIDYTRVLNDQFNLSAKITSMNQSGNDISKFAVSDLFLTGSHLITKNTHLTLGLKIPLNRQIKCKIIWLYLWIINRA